MVEEEDGGPLWEEENLFALSAAVFGGGEGQGRRSFIALIPPASPAI